PHIYNVAAFGASTAGGSGDSLLISVSHGWRVIILRTLKTVLGYVERSRAIMLLAQLIALSLPSQGGALSSRFNTFIAPDSGKGSDRNSTGLGTFLVSFNGINLSPG
ncbi:MAG: hypothetical protein VCB59_03595, partial [Gammaproteobacteria bacterium]